MMENEFNILKNMITDLSDAFYTFQEKALSMIGRNNDRLTKLEQICEDGEKYWQKFIKVFTAILMTATFIFVVLNYVKKG